MGKSERTVRSVKGMNDVLPGARQAFLDAAVWDHIHQTTGRVLEAYGYRFVRLPAVEETALFARGPKLQLGFLLRDGFRFQMR